MQHENKVKLQSVDILWLYYSTFVILISVYVLNKYWNILQSQLLHSQSGYLHPVGTNSLKK